MKLRRKIAKWAAVAAVGYLLDPASGSQRRSRLAAQLKALTVRWRPLRPPSDPTTLTELRDAFARHGLPLVDHSLNDVGDVVCGGCGQPNAPETMAREWRHRLEGASDPAELATVSGLRCGACAAVGVLTLPFGPATDELEADVLRRLPTPGTDHIADVLAQAGPVARGRAALTNAFAGVAARRRV